MNTRISEDWPEIRHPGRCPCAECRGGRRALDRIANASLSAALRHAQNRGESDFEAAVPSPTPPLCPPGTFSGWQWTEALDLTEMFRETVKAPFSTNNSGNLLYRIYEVGSERPLYIGMAYRNSIQYEVVDHLDSVFKRQGFSNNETVRALAALDLDSTGSEIDKLRILISKLGQATGSPIPKVAYGRVTEKAGYPLDAKLLHAFEATLQVLERPKSYSGSTRTFEESLADAADSVLDDMSA